MDGADAVRHDCVFVPYLKFLGGPSRVSWYQSAPEPGLQGRSIDLPRGRAVGGSSTINGMIYVRGQREDYDRWAELGNEEWGYDALLPYFKKIETFEALAHPETVCDLKLAGRPVAGTIDPAYHGTNGPVHISPIRTPNRLCDAFFAAAQRVGLPLNSDYNGVRQNGVGYYYYIQKNGWRHSAEAAYIDPIRDRPNLTIISDTKVLRLLLDGKRAIGAIGERKGERVEIRARREVLLCAGAFMSPQLLMLSGIGDSQQLAQHGIDTVQHLPGVGENLQDHVDTWIKFRAKSRVPYGISWGALPANIGHLCNWLLRRRGAFSSTTSEGAAFLSTDPTVERPDVQLFFNVSLGTVQDANSVFGHGWLVHICDLRPNSRGHVRLKSADPYEAPEILFNFFRGNSTMKVLVEGLKKVRQIMVQRDFEPHLAYEMAPGPDVQTDGALEAYVRENCATIYHPVGTCRMGRDELSVVDPTGLKVHGIDGLRVIDASVMPEIVSANTMAATFCIAEKAADFIKSDRATA